MLVATKNQKKHIFKLCKYDNDAKEEAVLSLTDGRTGSLGALTFNEANALIERLGGEPHYYENWAKFNKHNKQHMYVLSLCVQYGWTSLSPKYGAVANLMELSEWLKYGKKCPVNKPLTAMKTDELSKIITALEGMVDWKLKQNQ